MAITVRKTAYFKVGVRNKAGEGARLLGLLREQGVNLVAMSGFPRGGKAQIDVVPEDAAAFKKAMKQAKIPAGEKKTVFVIQGEDKVGAVSGILEKLGSAGVNVTAVDAVADGTGRYGAVLWVKPADVSKASRLLGAK
jgi:hypothetical protein